MSKLMATPAARRAADERRIDLCKITPTGITGYVQLSDVLAFKGTKATPLAIAAAKYYGVNIEKVETSSSIIKKDDVLTYKQSNQDTIIPVAGMRAVIAKRMCESLQNAPQYTNHSSFCVHELKKFMAGYKERNLEQNGIKPTYSDLLIKAASMALRDNIIMNSSFEETQITIHQHINIGLAVALEDGLIVPNIKDTDKKTLPEITADRKALVDKAKAGKLLPEEYSGGTFTISNMGGFPVNNFTPIINLPEAAILGVGTMEEKVVPIDGNIGIRPFMGISLTSDHRHIDGAMSGAFMKRLKEIIENPGVMED